MHTVRSQAPAWLVCDHGTCQVWALHPVATGCLAAVFTWPRRKMVLAFAIRDAIIAVTYKEWSPWAGSCQGECCADLALCHHVEGAAAPAHMRTLVTHVHHTPRCPAMDHLSI